MCADILAQTAIFNDAETAIIRTHEQEMKEPVSFLADDAFAEIESKCNVSPNVAGQVRMFCFIKETRKYICNYDSITVAERVTRKKEIEEQYMDSISRLLIPLNPNITGLVTGYALMMSRHLNLMPERHDSLMGYAIDYARRLRQNPCTYFAREEMDKLRRTLDDEQLKSAINAKNTTPARNRATALWQAVVNAHLEEGLDSTQQVRRAFLYYRNEMYIRDYFVEQQELLQANLNDLYMHKPKIIKMYEGIGTKEAVIKRHEKKVGMEFAW
jgi:hypothetical protein